MNTELELMQNKIKEFTYTSIITYLANNKENINDIYEIKSLLNNKLKDIVNININDIMLSQNWNVSLEVYLRASIDEWCYWSIKKCNFKCIISGEDFNEIHHPYPFHRIVKDTLLTLNIPKYNNISEYTKEELKLITDKCLELHYLHGHGMCLTKDLHKKYHSIFGNVNNNPQEFEVFKNHEINNIPYKKRELNKLLKESKAEYDSMNYEEKMFYLLNKNKDTNVGKFIEFIKSLSPGRYKKVWVRDNAGFDANSYFYNKILKHKMVVKFMKDNNIQMNRYNITIN